MSLSAKEQLIINNRRREVAKRYLKHMDQIDIAAELNVSQPTVSRDIEAINKKLEAAAKEDIQTRRARELAELDIMEKEAAENYYLSKQLTEGGRPSREMERWLKRWLEVKERKAKFLGLDQPAQIKIEDTGRETGTVVFYLPDNGRDPDFIPVAVPEKEIKE
jgi:DNA-binding CsgD family transcriptional regulator